MAFNHMFMAIVMVEALVTYYCQLNLYDNNNNLRGPLPQPRSLAVRSDHTTSLSTYHDFDLTVISYALPRFSHGPAYFSPLTSLASSLAYGSAWHSPVISCRSLIYYQ